MLQQEIGQVNASQTWEALCSDRKTLLIDVRTSMEWESIGVPDVTDADGTGVAFIEWQMFPSMAVNPRFVEEAQAAIRAAGAEEVYFICRSGVRSLHAAYAIAESVGNEPSCVCINVSGGFEGDPDATGARGRIDGWQARGLPWQRDKIGS